MMPQCHASIKPADFNLGPCANGWHERGPQK